MSEPTDPLIKEMEALLKLPNMCPETKVLIELAIQNQKLSTLVKTIIENAKKK